MPFAWRSGRPVQRRASATAKMQCVCVCVFLFVFAANCDSCFWAEATTRRDVSRQPRVRSLHPRAGPRDPARRHRLALQQHLLEMEFEACWTESWCPDPPRQSSLRYPGGTTLRGCCLAAGERSLYGRCGWVDDARVFKDRGFEAAGWRWQRLGPIRIGEWRVEVHLASGQLLLKQC